MSPNSIFFIVFYPAYLLYCSSSVLSCLPVSDTLNQPSPESPSINRTGKYHISLFRRKVEMGVISLLQPSTPVVHLISVLGLALCLRLLPFLCLLLRFLRLLFQHFGCEQSPCYCIYLQWIVRRKPLLMLVDFHIFMYYYKLNLSFWHYRRSTRIHPVADIKKDSTWSLTWELSAWPVLGSSASGHKLLGWSASAPW